jgi:hypothetical protein
MVEVDEFRDYEKACDALREAAGAWERSRAPGREDKVASLQHRVELVERFIGARQIVKTDPQVRARAGKQGRGGRDGGRAARRAARADSAAPAPPACLPRRRPSLPRRRPRS